MRRFLLLFHFSFIGIAGCGPKVAHLPNSGRSIVCFGNSLTQGVGGSPGRDYPSLLAERVSVPVINLGRSGETTEDGLRRMEEIWTHDPFLVIVEFGANDFFHRIPPEKTHENLSRIVREIQARGVAVAVAGVRIGLIRDEYDWVFRKAARENGALYIPNIMKGILSNPQLKSDQIHPNDAGYAVIAHRIHEAIRPLLKKQKV